jgi:hypothetical protein
VPVLRTTPPWHSKNGKGMCIYTLALNGSNMSALMFHSLDLDSSIGIEENPGNNIKNLTVDTVDIRGESIW